MGKVLYSFSKYQDKGIELFHTTSASRNTDTNKKLSRVPFSRKLLKVLSMLSESAFYSAFELEASAL